MNIDKPEYTWRQFKKLSDAVDEIERAWHSVEGQEECTQRQIMTRAFDFARRVMSAMVDGGPRAGLRVGIDPKDKPKRREVPR